MDSVASGTTADKVFDFICDARPENCLTSLSQASLNSRVSSVDFFLKKQAAELQE